MSNRILAFIVLLPIAGVIGFAAGRATSNTGTVAEAWSPDGGSRVHITRTFSLGPKQQRLMFEAGGQESDVRALSPDDAPGEIVWSPDGSLAGVVLNGATLAVIDPGARRMIYELPLLEQRDGSRMARGVGFSANAMAITFDDCPKRGAGCRPRLMALPEFNPVE
ncbi:MAG: hypothetical protein M3Q55_04265 [Acidobacteriota bacterium]|nr:hypothetical protein [Acidobacteriota bacterium]